MSHIFDQFQDTNGQEYHKLLATYGVDDFAKKASFELKAGVPDTAGNLYADPVERYFYCGTAPGTFASSVFFYHQKTALERDRAEIVEARLLKAADYFGIRSVVDAVKDTIHEKQAHTEASLSDDDFALVWVSDDGKDKERRYALRNPSEVEKAASYLQAHVRDFPYAHRRLFAEKVLRKAAELGVHVQDQDFLMRTAGYGTCSAQSAAETLFDRAKVLKKANLDPEDQRFLAMSAKYLLENQDQAHLPSTLRKVASLIDTIDRKHHIDWMEPPEDILFVITEKTASAFKNSLVPASNGAVYLTEKLAALHLAQLQDHFGDDFVESVAEGLWVSAEKMAEVLPHLSPMDAEQFEKVATTYGCAPVFRQNAQAVKIEPEVLAELAEMHSASRLPI